MTGRRRFLAAYAALTAAGLALAGGTAWLLAPGGRDTRVCSERIPAGRSIDAAWRTTEMFVADVMLGRQPVCGYDLSTSRLRGARSRAEWGRGRPPVRPFASGYPAVPIARASRDPGAREAVYILSRREAGFVVQGSAGRPEIPMLVGLAAPRVGRGAYNLALVVERGSWRVDRVTRVAIVDE